MNGLIAHLIRSPWPRDADVRKRLFGNNFQTINDWKIFLDFNLINSRVRYQLRAPSRLWNIESFHALYVACWIHHPVEKGTYMIDLVDIGLDHQNVLHGRIKKLLSSRVSSHLSGKGRSASKGWDFLNGYHELLIQFEYTKGRPFLLLKAEGHTTGLSGIGPHMASWWTKIKTGEGNTASPDLKSFANLSPLVEGRAAENYAKGYESLVEWVGLTGKFCTVREVMFRFLKKVNYPKNVGWTYHYFDRATNSELAQLLFNYVRNARANHANVFRGGKRYVRRKVVLIKKEERVSDKMLSQLEELAQTLQNDGHVRKDRVYKEVRVRPSEIDQSLDYFYSLDELSIFKPGYIPPSVSPSGFR